MHFLTWTLTLHFSLPSDISVGAGDDGVDDPADLICSEAELFIISGFQFVDFGFGLRVSVDEPLENGESRFPVLSSYRVRIFVGGWNRTKSWFSGTEEIWFNHLIDKLNWIKRQSWAFAESWMAFEMGTFVSTKCKSSKSVSCQLEQLE